MIGAVETIETFLPVGDRTIMSQDYETLRVTHAEEGTIAIVEMHRPEALNAMNTTMGRDLLDCFEHFFWDKQVRVVILTGAGDKAFCVGGDLRERQGMSDEAWQDQHIIFEQAAFRVLRCPQPVIAAVEGFAMGGGCELAVLADFIVASDTAVFAVPEVTRGIFPGIGGTQLLPRIVGAPFAKEMIYTGRRVPAVEAQAVGLINHLVPAGQARTRALEVAATIAKNGPIAVRQAKKAIAWGAETDLETGMMLAIEAYNGTVHTEDRLEGVRAFNERRPPRFHGR
jgi:enoyl-CoA hydratase/carnithine racemase